MRVPLLRRCRVPMLALMVFVLCGAAGASAARAVSVQAPNCGATLTVAANADAWIDQNSASNNFGSDALLQVQSKQPGINFRALVRFALPAAAPAGCVVDLATLRLYVESGDEGRSLEAVRITGAWTESGVTWSNQPPTADLFAAIPSGRTGYRGWDVTAQVQAIYDAGANHGFLIRDAVEDDLDGGDQKLFSREKGENPPLLRLRFRPVGPPPAPGAPLPPAPAAVTCGQVLTKSTQLTNNLTEYARWR